MTSEKDEYVRLQVEESDYHDILIRRTDWEKRPNIYIEQDDDRLYLDMPAAAALWLILKRFAETGQIGDQS